MTRPILAAAAIALSGAMLAGCAATADEAETPTAVASVSKSEAKRA